MKHAPLLLALGLAFLFWMPQATAELPHDITIDGNFDDWAGLPSYTDAADDTHDTDHTGRYDTPVYVEHPDVDLVEFKFTHDSESLCAYFRATGTIGNTVANNGNGGRYYVIVTIDVDNDEYTGYWLNEGGYYPTTGGYDVNMEVEYFDGTFNSGNYLNHGCTNDAELQDAFADQTLGVIALLPGIYDFYTQWVFWDEPPGIPGEIVLPDGHSTIFWVADKGPVYDNTIVTIAISPDGHEAEMRAPFRGFLTNKQNGEPIMGLGQTLNVSFSLEASGQLAPSGEWASDTADPIIGYVTESAPASEGEGEGQAEGEGAPEGETTQEGEGQAEGEVFAEGEGSSEGEIPLEGEIITEGETPQEGEIITEGETPQEGEILAEGETPQEGEILAEGEASSEGETPLEGEAVSEGETPLEGEAVSEGEPSTEGETISEGETPQEGESTQEGEAVLEGESVQEGEGTDNRLQAIRVSLLVQFNALDADQNQGLSYAEAHAAFSDLTLPMFEELDILSHDGYLSRVDLGEEETTGCTGTSQPQKAQQQASNMLPLLLGASALLALRRRNTGR